MRPINSLLTLLAAAATAVACSSDSTTSPTSTTLPTNTTSTGISLIIDTTTNNQTVVVGSTITLKLRVMQGTINVSAVPIAWSLTSGEGALSAATTVTDTLGLATVNLRASDTVGTNTVTATITGASVVYTVKTIAGAASGLLKISPDSQAVVVNGAVPLTARVVDRFGNAVTGAMVSFATSGGALSAASTATGTSGNATTNLTVGPTAATYFVTATLANKASVTFKVVGF